MISNFLKRERFISIPRFHRGSAHIILSKERHDELIRAELNDFANKQTRPLTLKEIQKTTHTHTASVYLHRELSIRFAGRIKQLENLPKFEFDQLVKNVRNIYFESFRQLRDSNYTHIDEFIKVLQNLKKRHSNIVPMLVTGVRSLKKQFADELTTEKVDDFLNTFFLSRIGTEMLTSNFLSPSGIVDSRCDVMLVLKRAAEDAEKLCCHHYSHCPKVMIWNLVAQRLPYVPQYLYYILFELLKNAMRAVVEHDRLERNHKSVPLDEFSLHIKTNDIDKIDKNKIQNKFDYIRNKPHYQSQQSSKYLPPIEIVLSGDDHEVAIKMSDQGGGIDRKALPKIWSYMYTTARPVTIRVPAFKHEDNGGIVNSLTPTVGSLDTKSSNNEVYTQIVSPLAGFGCGLPLSRLYASYLGGNLELVSMPNYGTDSFLFLNRLGDVQVRG